MMKTVSALLLLTATTARGEAEYSYEMGFHNGFLFSQEFASDIFADHDSDVRPIPAYVLVLDGEARVARRLHLVSLLTIPTREEVVTRKGKEPWTYYYPKTILVGLEYDVLPLALGSEGRSIEHRLGFGLNTPPSRIASASCCFRCFRYACACRPPKTAAFSSARVTRETEGGGFGSCPSAFRIVSEESIMPRKTFVPPQGPPDTLPDAAIYLRMGEEGIRRMMSDFYERLARSEIAEMFPTEGLGNFKPRSRWLARGSKCWALLSRLVFCLA